MRRLFLLLISLAPFAHAEPTPTQLVLDRARQEVARGVRYDSSYVRLAYPNGDPDPAQGVCTDVIVRGMRGAQIDLQVKVHEDVLRAPDAYAAWVKSPDTNIDHRRVGPLMVYFARHGKSLPVADESSYAAGDVVVWSFSCKTSSPGCYPHHIGFVSDKKGARGLPLVIHNIGPRPSEDDSLDAFVRIAHYRVL